jgi:hypothetical protein
MGIKAVLKIRFGDAGLQLMPEIEESYDEQKLEALLNALETAASVEEVRRLWAPLAQQDT